jgi:hypothetical protein
MIATRSRRNVPLAIAFAVLLVAVLPWLSGTALAATVSANPNSVPNSGPVTVTLTSGPGMFTATSSKLVNHDNASVVFTATTLSSPDVAHTTQRQATFDLTNALPGDYDITVTEPGGNETCVSSAGSPCFTVVGLPPTISVQPPPSLVTGASTFVNGSVAVQNPARGSDYPQTAVELLFGGVPGLQASDLTVQAQYTAGVWTPVALSDTGGAVVGYVTPAGGQHIAPNQTFAVPLRYKAVAGAPTGTMTMLGTFGDFNTSTGTLSDFLASDHTDTHIARFAGGTWYHPVTPVRVLDTRTGLGHSGALAPRTSMSLVVGGTHGVPTTAKAVALNVTAIGGTASGYLTVYPTGVTRPTTSNINYGTGVVIANLAVVPLSPSSHAVTIFNGGSPAQVHVVGDLVGYYSVDSTGSAFHPLAPARVLDTRTGSGTPIAPGGTKTLTVAGLGGVPASGANAVAVSVTPTQPQKTGYLKVYQAGTAEPATSSVDFVAGQTVANLVLVPLSSSGQLTILNRSGGTVHVIADVQGYFTPSGNGSSLHPGTPVRVLDTRTGTGPIPANGAITLTLGGTHGLPGSGITMLAVNLAVISPSRPGQLVAYAAGAVKPATSNTNFAAGQTVAELAYVKVTDNGGITIYNRSNAAVQVVADLQGWASAP